MAEHFSLSPDSGYWSPKGPDDVSETQHTPYSPQTHFDDTLSGYAPYQTTSPTDASHEPDTYTVASSPRNPARDTPPTELVRTPRSNGRTVIDIAQVDRYPPKSAVVPPELSCFEVCQQYPNNLYAENLDAFIQYGWSSSQIYDCLPEEVKKAMTANHSNSKNEANALSKRLQKRRTKLSKSGELELLMNAPKIRTEGREAGFKANSRFAPGRISKKAKRAAAKARREREEAQSNQEAADQRESVGPIETDTDTAAASVLSPPEPSFANIDSEQQQQTAEPVEFGVEEPELGSYHFHQLPIEQLNFGTAEPLSTGYQIQHQPFEASRLSTPGFWLTSHQLEQQLTEASHFNTQQPLFTGYGAQQDGLGSWQNHFESEAALWTMDVAPFGTEAPMQTLEDGRFEYTYEDFAVLDPRMFGNNDEPSNWDY